MGYFYLIQQALIFSFGGLMIKSVGTMLSPFLTSCLRFTIGIALLFLIQRIRTGKLRLAHSFTGTDPHRTARHGDSQSVRNVRHSL